MTQITNVLYIVIIAIAMSVGATLLTILVDHSFDIPGYSGPDSSSHN